MKTTFTIIMLIAGFLCAEAQDWTWLEYDNLPYAREGLSATELEGSIYFSGGKLANGTFVNIIDIYDVELNVWDTYEPETPGRMMSNAISANGMVFIAGGNRWPGGSHYAEIDVYNKAEDEWTIDSLSEARHLMGVTALGNKVFFAGGGKFQGSPNNILYDVIDIYDTETGLWDTAYLSIPRWLIGAAAAGSKVFFAGGTTGINEVTDVVDVYDTETGLWDTVYLSQARAFTAAVAFGDSLVCFAGGSLPNEISSDVIDIYNVNTGVWTVEYLSEPRVTSALNVKDALVFTGLCYFVDVNGMNIGSSNGTVDIYYPKTGQWNLSVPDLNPSRNFLGFTSYDNMAYYAGGRKDTGTPTDVISILEYDYISGFLEDNFQKLVIRILPNPFTSTIRIDYNLQHSGKVDIAIYNNIGKQVQVLVDKFQQQGEQQVLFNAEKLHSGIYFCVLKTSEGVQTKKMIKL